MTATSELILVEDDPDDLVLVVKAIRRVAPTLTMETARDGVELFALLERRADAELPRLILLDLNLPRMDGREALGRLRASPRLRGIPVVVMTTSIEAEDQSMTQALGAVGFISKPDDFGTLLTQLNTLFTNLLPEPTSP